MTRLLLISLVIKIYFCSPLFGASSLRTFKNHSTAGVLTEVSTTTPGGAFWMALRIKPDKGWHSYWVNPGDSGAAPILRISSPDEGIAVSELFWPVPTRIPAGPLMTFGFENDTGIFWKISIPKEFRKNTISLDVDAEWLVCKVDCIPAFHTFTLQIPLSDHQKPSEASDFFKKNTPLLPGLAVTDIQVTENKEFFFADLQNMFIDFFPLDHNLSYSPPEKDGNRLKIRKNINSTNSSEKTGLLVFQDPRNNGLSGMYARLKIKQDSGDHIPAFLPMLWLMISSFLGGLLLNFMPCVFPVLALKVFGIGKLGGSSRKKQAVNSIAYQAGASFFFLSLAVSLWVLRQSGTMVGWGFQLQSPGFVFALSCLFVVLGTSYLGLLPEFSAFIPQKFYKISTKNSPVGEFFTGMLAVLVATPCTAPLMGAALGVAVSQSFPVMILIFLSMSVGFGAPFLLLPVIPALAKKLPAPGPWMITCKELLSFPMFGTAIWLMWIYGSLANHTAAVYLICIWLCWFAVVWLIKKNQNKNRALKISALAALFLLGSVVFPRFQNSETFSLDWLPFSKDSLKNRLIHKESIFVNITADWCITCQVNDRLVFKNPEFAAWIKEQGIVMFKGDWTRYNPDITAYLKQYDRASLPFYAWYQKGSEKPVILPELLTTTLVKDILSQENLRGEL